MSFVAYKDGNVDTTALANPATLLEPPAGAIQLANEKSAIILFGGSDAANETINYQAIGWLHAMNEVVSALGCWVPVILAKGIATLGAKTYGATGTRLGATGNLWVDTITDGDTVYSLVPTAVGDDAIAVLVLDLEGFAYLTIDTDLGTAASADVFVQLSRETIQF